MPPDRAEVILPGAVTLLACLDLLDAPGFHWTFRGLRYGAWVRWISGTPFGRVHHLPGSRS
jgi:exopolyphosphatase/pppGpp-phosphohydrolase